MARTGIPTLLTAAVAFAATAGATVPTDRTSYLAAPTYAARYVALRTPAYRDALQPDADGRVLGHLPYPATVEAPIAALVGIDPALRTKACDLLPPAAAAAEDMMRAADAALGPNLTLRAQSCFRSIAEQVGIFCNKVRDRPTGDCVDPRRRAEVSAPPGHSEHATGYTVDFVACTARSKGCGGLATGFGDTPQGLWLMAHAREYGFELSFPCADPRQTPCRTAQGVSYEPWHWRWVGRNAASPGAADARRVFAAARRCFPAYPAVDTGGVPNGPCPAPSAR